VTTFECLGHKIQHNGSVRDCWNATRSAMWRSFWGNAASAGAAHLSQPLKLRLLQRATAPPLHYRASRWPPQKFIKSQLDITQRKMVGVLMKVAPYPEERLSSSGNAEAALQSKFAMSMGGGASNGSRVQLHGTPILGGLETSIRGALPSSSGSGGMQPGCSNVAQRGVRRALPAALTPGVSEAGFSNVGRPALITQGMSSLICEAVVK